MIMKHKRSGMAKEIPSGFSWTSLLFGVFVPLTRKDFKGFFIQLGMVFLFSMIGLPFVPWLIIPFIYNKFYKEMLESDGWEEVK